MTLKIRCDAVGVHFKISKIQQPPLGGGRQAPNFVNSTLDYPKAIDKARWTTTLSHLKVNVLACGVGGVSYRAPYINLKILHFKL